MNYRVFIGTLSAFLALPVALSKALCLPDFSQLTILSTALV